jgi:hypothetical protein
VPTTNQQGPDARAARYRRFVLVALLVSTCATSAVRASDPAAGTAEEQIFEQAKGWWLKWREAVRVCVLGDKSCQTKMLAIPGSTGAAPQGTGLEPAPTGARPSYPPAPAFFLLQDVIKRGSCDENRHVWTPLPDELRSPADALLRQLDEAERQIRNPRQYPVETKELGELRQRIERCLGTRP